MQALYEPTSAAVERQLLDELSIDAPWALIEPFTTLVRDERKGIPLDVRQWAAAPVPT